MNKQFSLQILIQASKATYSILQTESTQASKLKTHHDQTKHDLTLQPVVIDLKQEISTKTDSRDLLKTLSREEKKKEASKPLYLIRYE